jgi:gas vesicle protein
MADETPAIEEETAPESPEEEKRARSGPGFILGVVLGMVAGAAGATLFAPDTGEETRQPFEGEGGPEVTVPDAPMARVRGVLDRMRSRVQEASAEAQEAAREAEEQSRARYEELTQQGPPA